MLLNSLEPLDMPSQRHMQKKENSLLFFGTWMLQVCAKVQGLVVKQMMSYLIKVKIMTSSATREDLFISRITIIFNNIRLQKIPVLGVDMFCHLPKNISGENNESDWIRNNGFLFFQLYVFASSDGAPKSFNMYTSHRKTKNVFIKKLCHNWWITFWYKLSHVVIQWYHNNLWYNYSKQDFNLVWNLVLKHLLATSFC